MNSHAAEFRSVCGDDKLYRAIKVDWRSADLSKLDKEICEFAEKLTLKPYSIKQKDIENLRSEGLDDRGITDVVEVIGYFNYINRVADGLGVDPEDWME